MADSYNNGPLFGDSPDSPQINSGFIVSDTFVFQHNVQVTGFNFSLWLIPGDPNVITSAELSITSQPNGGTFYFDQVLTGWFQVGDCLINEFGYNQCEDSVNFSGPTLNGGTTYWVNIQNASVPSRNPILWDQNFGMGCTSPGCPSQAYESGIGTIGSETFTIYGSPTPEPSSILLFGSGILALAGLLRRRPKL
jgi:hypothetical protein